MHKYISIGVIILAMLSNIFAAPKKKPKKQVATSSRAAVDKFPLHTAARDGNIEQVQSLVEQQPSIIDSRNNNGRTPIMEAAVNGYDVVVEYLAQHQADIELHDNDSKTALLLAAASGHLEAVKRLMEAKRNIDKATVFHAQTVAWRNGYYDVVAFLSWHSDRWQTYAKLVTAAAALYVYEHHYKNHKCSLM